MSTAPSNTIFVHVTRVRDGGVYGHTTDHCDESGCNGYEQFFSELTPDDVGDDHAASFERDAQVSR